MSEDDDRSTGPPPGRPTGATEEGPRSRVGHYVVLAVLVVLVAVLLVSGVIPLFG